MQQIPVKKEDFFKVKQILSELFPAIDENKFTFGDKGDKLECEYYLLIKDGKTVGVTNAYCYGHSKESRWLGWFGILAEYQRKGLGSEALRLFELDSKQKGFTHARVFTDKFENEGAIAFYQKNGYTSEDYYCKEDVASTYYKVLIFSKNLCGNKVVGWNNKSISLTLELKKQL